MVMNAGEMRHYVSRPLRWQMTYVCCRSVLSDLIRYLHHIF
ncbi:hypothetical protein Plhal304r1_c021g0075191 [Plasmopara halstedii]